MWRTLKLGLLLVLCLTPFCLSQKSKKKKNKKWKDYRRFWCTDFGRELITRGTTEGECQNYCGDGCEAVEWWENGKNACYQCKDLKLLTEFPKRLKNDLSFPPHVFIKRIPGKVLPKRSDLMMTTAKPFTVTTPTEETSTTSSYKEGTTVASKSKHTQLEHLAISTSKRPYTTTSPVIENGTTSSTEVETSPSAAKEGTTTPTYKNKEEEGTTTSSEEEETTTSTGEERTTTISEEEEETTTSLEEKGMITSPEKEGTTTSHEEEGTTTPSEEEGTTTSPEEEGTTTSPEEKGTTAPPEEEGTTTSPEVEGTSTSPEDEGTTTSTGAEGTTTSQEEEGTTTPSEEGGTTTSPEEEGTTTSPEEKGTTTPSEVEGTTTSPEEEGTTTPSEGEETLISTGGERTTTSPEEEGTTTSPEVEGTTTSPEEEGTTTSSEEKETLTSTGGEGTTTSPEEATFPDKPRNIKAKAISETEIEVTWDPPVRTGSQELYYEVRVAEVTEELEVITERLIRVIRMPGTSLSFVIRSLSPESRYIIMVSAGNDYGISGWSDVVYSETPKAIKARIEPKDCPGKNNTNQKAEEMPSCVKVEKDDKIYTVNVSYGRWPDDGFCRTLVDSEASKHDAYVVSADLYVPEGSSDDVYLGVFFNAEDENNFDFISFRFGSSDNSCFQTGTVRNGQINWFGSQTGSCPFGPPPKERWTSTALEIRDSEVTVFLDSTYITSFKAHLLPKAAGGVAVGNHHGNVIRFKDFSITDLPFLPFEDKSCASLQDHKEYYSVISQNDHWFQSFCRALAKGSLKENETSYQISVDLFSEVDWSGDRLAYLGIIFNARDINNADFIYFRPFWKDYCYQTGYLLAGYQMREASKTGPCSCALKGGRWFNVHLEIRGNIVTVIMNGIPTTTFRSHYSSINKGSGILVTGGRRMAIRFRNLLIWSLPQLPFVSKNCQSTRVADKLDGDVFTLLAYSGLEQSDHPGICRALIPKIIEASSYDISVKIQAKGSLMGGKYGIIFNVKNADSFDFVSFRPYHPSSCVEAGHIKANKVIEYSTTKFLPCTYGILKSRRWHNVRVKVAGNGVKVLVDDVEVAGFKSQFEVNGRGGVMVASGFKRKLSFKNFRIFN